MIKLVVFDLDDTLISEVQYVKSGFRVVAEYLEKKYGFQGTYGELEKLFQKNRQLVFNRYLDSKNVTYSQEEIEKIVEIYKKHEPKIEFFPDVEATLILLKQYGIKSAILTDGIFSTQELKIKAVDGEKFFEEILYTDKLGRDAWKPSPRGFEVLKEKFDISYDEMIYVGDNPKKDFMISKIHPVHTVRILRREAIYQNEEYLEEIKEEYTIKDLRELEEILLNHGAIRKIINGKGGERMKKVLFVASITKHINTFHIPYLKCLKEEGYEVHVASNGEEKINYCDKHFNVEFERSPFRKENKKAYRELKKIINDGEYDIIHCHTPVASVMTRLAAKKARKKGTKVLYTAHGFHFYKGAPMRNWIIYYPIEKYLSKYTDVLITINEEDYEFAKKKLNAGRVEHIHGIGIEEKKFKIDLSESKRDEMRENFTCNSMDFVMLYAAELNDNKNQKMLIDAMKKLVPAYPNIKLLLAGDGPFKEKFEKEIQENFLQSNVLLIGYRTDIPELLKISDLYVATSKREGLPINILEAMISGLPLVVTNSRGQRELVEDGKNGYIVEIGDVDSLVEKIRNIYLDSRMRSMITKNARANINKYLLPNVLEEMKRIYHLEE